MALPVDEFKPSCASRGTRANGAHEPRETGIDGGKGQSALEPTPATRQTCHILRGCIPCPTSEVIHGCQIHSLGSGCCGKPGGVSVLLPWLPMPAPMPVPDDSGEQGRIAARLASCTLTSLDGDLGGVSLSAHHSMHHGMHQGTHEAPGTREIRTGKELSRKKK